MHLTLTALCFLVSFVSGRLFRRCYVHRSLSGVALLPETANVGEYRRCQHFWLLRALHPHYFTQRSPARAPSGYANYSGETAFGLPPRRRGGLWVSSQCLLPL